MVSAVCTINGSVLPISGTTGLNVAGGSTITIALSNSAGVTSWSINCTFSDGSNPLSNYLTINATKEQNFTNNTCTFTAPALDGYIGASLQFTSIVNAGQSWNTDTQVMGVFVLGTSGFRMIFDGESTESNATFGPAPDINEAIINAGLGGGGGSNFVAGGDLSGSATSQNVIAIRGNPVSSSTATAGEFLIENSGATGSAWTALSGDISGSTGTPGKLTVTALQGNAVQSGTNGSTQDGYVLTWHNAASQFQVLPQTGGSGFTAGGDLSGTSTSQQVAKIQGTVISGTPAANKALLATSGSAASWGFVPQINNVVVSATNPTAGQILTAISGTSASWQTIATGGFTAGGDLSGTSTSQKVIAIQGNPVNAAAPTASQILIENSGATGSVWTTISQDGYLGTGGSGNPQNWRGVNVPGFVIGPPTVVPSEGSNYIAPATADISYLTGKYSGSGATKTVVLSFQFEAMQCTTGNMSTAVITNTISKTANSYCVNYFAAVDAFLAAGWTVVIKAHQLNASDSVAFTYQNIAIGSAGFSYAQFGAAWAMISALYSSNSNVWFSLMNEPNGVTDTQFTSAMQTAITAIRANNTVGQIVINGVNYASCAGFFTGNYSGTDTPAVLYLGLTDSANKLICAVHNYGDGVNGYAGESNALDNTSVLVTYLGPVITWATTNSVRIFVEEFAVDSTNGIASATIANMYAAINASPSVVVASTWWLYTSVGFGPSLFDLQPTTPYTVDCPDMTYFVELLVYSTSGGGTLGALEVTGLLTHQLPSLTDGYLNWTGSAWALSSVSGGFTAGGDLSGTSTSQIVDSAQSGLIVFTATTGNIEVASTATAPGLGQTTVATNSATGKNMSISAQSASGTTSIGGNVVISAGTGTSTNGSVQFVAGGVSDTIAPSQGTVGTQLGKVVTYTGFATVLDNTVTAITIPLPGGAGTFSSVSLALQGIWRVTTTTGKGSVGTQMLLATCANINGTVSQQGTASNIAGPSGSATYLSEISFSLAISGTNILVQLVSTTATNSFDCTVLCTAVFN